MSAINDSTSPAVYWWRPACWLRVSGEDAASFLQGQFTNELRGLKPGAAAYGLWLNVKGKVLADSFVLRGPAAEEFWLGSYFSPAAIVRERLESHIIADDVTIEDVTGDWSAASVWGNAEANLPAGIFRFPGRRSREENAEWIFPHANTNDVRALLAAARELDADELARRRIDAGIPAIPIDIGPGDLPNEGGLEAAAISYTKGCYLGQEVMARLKSMGQVRRRLLRVASESARAPALPAEIFVGGRRVGELRSAASQPAGGFIGLAMLALMQVKADTPLAFAPDGAPALFLRDTP